MSIEENECIFVLMSLRLALTIVYFLVMNSKRCTLSSLLFVCSGGVLSIRHWALKGEVIQKNVYDPIHHHHHLLLEQYLFLSFLAF